MRAGCVTKVEVVEGKTGLPMHDWFLALEDGFGVCLCITGQETWTYKPDGGGLWNLGGCYAMPSEEWPDEVCAAVAREKLINA